MTDELKPVRCGCGGEAIIYVTHWWGKCYVCECDECGITTKPCDTEAEAITAWNRAMGATDKNVGDKERKKGEWIKHENPTLGQCLKIVYECSVCHKGVGCEYFVRRSFCPNCGARMDRSE